jgi:fibrillarin-like rRNA methylase
MFWAEVITDIVADRLEYAYEYSARLFVAIKLTDMVKSQHNIRKVLKWES